MMRAVLEEDTAIEVQHINVKLLLDNPEDLDLDAVVNVFHSWIQDQVCEEQLLDVADYRHVHHGPGVVLIGHEADYSIDNTDGRLGVRYNRKAPLPGSNHERLAKSLRAALAAAERLQLDTRLNPKCGFNLQDIEIFINDRALAPNQHETRQALEPEFRSFLNSLLGGSGYSLEFETDARKLFGLRIKAKQPVSIADLLANLGRPDNPAFDVL
jgi:hypothetical protein